MNQGCPALCQLDSESLQGSQGFPSGRESLIPCTYDILTKIHQNQNRDRHSRDPSLKQQEESSSRSLEGGRRQILMRMTEEQRANRYIKVSASHSLESSAIRVKWQGHTGEARTLALLLCCTGPCKPLNPLSVAPLQYWYSNNVETNCLHTCDLHTYTAPKQKCSVFLSKRCPSPFTIPMKRRRCNFIFLPARLLLKNPDPSPQNLVLVFQSFHPAQVKKNCLLTRNTLQVSGQESKQIYCAC